MIMVSVDLYWIGKRVWVTSNMKSGGEHYMDITTKFFTSSLTIEYSLLSCQELEARSQRYVPRWPGERREGTSPVHLVAPSLPPITSVLSQKSGRAWGGSS